MNVLQGNITKIITAGSLSLVRLTSNGCALNTIVVDTPSTSPYLKIDHPVNVLFKETEVILAKQLSGNISLTNKIKCLVKSFECDDLLCKVSMDFNGSKINAIITKEAFEIMNIAEKDEIFAMINANEVSLSPHA